MSDRAPRRICLDRMTPAELAIHTAVQAVEAAGCDTRLTDAINLLHAAREKVADFVDGITTPCAKVIDWDQAERCGMSAGHDGECCP